MGKQVAIICDIHGWAFENIARGIIRYNPDPELEFELFWQRDFLEKKADVSALKDFDILYASSVYQADYLPKHGFNEYITTVHMAPLTVALKPGESINGRDYEPYRYKAAMQAKRLSAFSPLLEQAWRQERSDLRVVRVGADPLIFYPWTQARGNVGDLRVGWVGDSTKPYKCFDLVKAATEDLDGVELCTVIGGYSWGVPKTQEDMGYFYRSLDVYLCTSDHEGLPTPGLEASVCGIPFISVPVGITSELIEHGHTGYIVDQDPAQIRRYLVHLRDHRELCKEMGRAMAVKAKKFIWPNVVREWIEFIKG